MRYYCVLCCANLYKAVRYVGFTATHIIPYLIGHLIDTLGFGTFLLIANLLSYTGQFVKVYIQHVPCRAHNQWGLTHYGDVMEHPRPRSQARSIKDPRAAKKGIIVAFRI